MPSYFVSDFSTEQFGVIMTTFSPYILIAYLTTMLSADLHFAKRKFKQLSETDEMTGLENLRSFKHTLQLEVQKASRYKHVFSVLMIDADGLKALASTGQVFDADKTILTPHWGELQILLKRKSGV